MIKKLPIDGIDKNDKIVCNTKDDLVCKINEVIDYLQAKEEDSRPKYHKKDCKYMVSAGYDDCNCEEASKGECKHESIGHELPRDRGNFNAPPVCMGCGRNLVEDNPPKSRGECECCLNQHLDRGYSADGVCGKCKHDINPPEHEDWESAYDRIFYGCANSIAHKSYIRDNFVSKEKIKNLATQMGMRSSAKIVQLKTLNRLQIEDIIYDKILESLGLGD